MHRAPGWILFAYPFRNVIVTTKCVREGEGRWRARHNQGRDPCGAEKGAAVFLR